MLKVKDFVFALLTLIWVSPVVGEERTIYPRAKEWPKFEGFEWGISEDEFFEACAEKKLERGEAYENGFYPKNHTGKSKRLVARGILLGHKVEIIPKFDKLEGKLRKGVGLTELEFYFKFKMVGDLSKPGEFEKRLLKVLRDKYGPSKSKSWGAPHKPHRACIIAGQWTEDKDGPTDKIVYLNYKSKSGVDNLDALLMKKAAEKRAFEKKAKEDEKDF